MLEDPRRIAPVQTFEHTRRAMAMFADRFSRYYPNATVTDELLAGIVAVFCKYPIEIVEKAISPAFGMPQTFKSFLPSLGEIGDYLEKEIAPLRRAEERERIRAQNALLLPAPDREERLTYAELCAKYGGNGKGEWGLKTKKRKLDPFPSPAQLKELAGDKWDEIKNQPEGFLSRLVV